MKKPNIPQNEKERQAALDSYNIIDSLPEQSFDDLTLIASQICNTPIALISLVDNNRQWFKSKFGLNANETHRDISFCGHAINEPNQIFEVNNAKEDERFSDNPLVIGELNIGFYAGVPLIDSSDLALGTLCVIDKNPRELTDHQKRALEALARVVMNKIKLRRSQLNLEENLEDTLQEIVMLEENNFRYQSLFEFAPLGIVISDLKGNLIQTNEVFEEMIEYSKEELKMISVAKLTYPDDREETKAYMGKLMTGEIRHFTIEKRYIAKNGNIKWGRVSSAFVPNSMGKPTYMIATIEDISRRRELDQEYAFNMERLDLAVKGTNDGIWDWFDVKQDQQWWSPRFHELLGYKEGEIDTTLTSFTDILLHPEDQQHTQKALEDCFQKGLAADVEHRLKTKSGEYKWFRGRGDVTRNSEGKPIRMTGSISDIDKRKKLALKLEETERFQSKITQIVPSIIYVFNQKTLSNEYANREIGTVMGFSNKEIQALGDQLIPTLCHPDDLYRVLRHFQTVTKLKDNETVTIEYRMKHKDGNYRWLLSEDAVFERDHDGSSIKHIGVATDITKLKRVQEQLSIQTKQLQMQNDDLKQLNYVATHDLKSPIITLKGYFDLLKNELKNQPNTVTESLEFMKEEFQNFKTTQEGLTEAIRIREDEVKHESVDIGKIVQELSTNYSNKIDKLKGKLIVDLVPQIEIRGNRVYVKSILQNLISNAIKYRSAKRPPIITIKSRVAKKMLILTIEDNGLGIDLELQKDRIFKMFNRFHHHSEGSGMGLYMVRSMVEKIDGKINIESEVEKGTCFSIQFRLA